MVFVILIIASLVVACGSEKEDRKREDRVIITDHEEPGKAKGVNLTSSTSAGMISPDKLITETFV